MRLKNKMGFKELHRIIKDTRAEADRSVDIRLAGEPADLHELKNVLGTDADRVFKPVGEESENWTNPDIDLVVLTFSGGAAIQPWLQRAAGECRADGLEMIALVEQAELAEAGLTAKKIEAELAFDLSPGRVVFYSREMSGSDRAELTRKILDRMPEKEVSLAALVPLFRAPVVGDIIDEIANENGLIGLTSIFPGTDLPLLTANQMRMVLKIAAAFDVQLSLRRARELIFVLGGGFAFRAVARQVASLIPVAGWAVKGAVAYTGTRTVGMLAQRYFETLNE